MIDNQEHAISHYVRSAAYSDLLITASGCSFLFLPTSKAITVLSF